MFTALIAALVVSSTPPTSPRPPASEPRLRTLGLGPGVTGVFTDDPATPPLMVSLWLEGAFKALARVESGAPTPSGAGWVVVTGGQVGARHLFGASLFRPFLGLQLGALYLLSPYAELRSNLLAGPGALAGVELRASESISVRAQGTFDWLLTLNGPQRFALGATVAVAASF